MRCLLLQRQVLYKVPLEMRLLPDLPELTLSGQVFPQAAVMDSTPGRLALDSPQPAQVLLLLAHLPLSQPIRFMVV